MAAVAAGGDRMSEWRFWDLHVVPRGRGSASPSEETPRLPPDQPPAYRVSGRSLSDAAISFAWDKARREMRELPTDGALWTLCQAISFARSCAARMDLRIHNDPPVRAAVWELRRLLDNAENTVWRIRRARRA